jgi:DUF4097 and DUF4098 domain-containing protein YvlB
MLITAIAAALALAVPGTQQSDTTITVAGGARLDVETHGGSITIDTWNRNEVRVQATHGSRDEIQVRTRGSVVRVDAENSRGGPAIIDYRITVPAAMDLELEGIYTEITVSGTQGQVSASTVQGNITVTGGTGQVELESVQGRILVDGARGTVRAASVAGQVRLRNIRGPIEAESVSGRVVIEGASSNQVSAETVSGRIYYDGAIEEGGSYSFVTHSGSVTVSVPGALNSTISVATISGSLESSFPGLTTTGSIRGRRQSLTAGNGNSTLELESFSGDLRLVRRGEVSPPAL